MNQEQAKQETCEERVDAHLESRYDDLQQLWDAYCAGEEDVDDIGNIYEYGLSFDYVEPETFGDQPEGYWRYLISWGGPSEEIRFFANGPNYTLYKAEFWFLDWFDGAKRHIFDRELTQELWQFFVDIGSVEAEYQKAIET